MDEAGGGEGRNDVVEKEERGVGEGAEEEQGEGGAHEAGAAEG